MIPILNKIRLGEKAQGLLEYALILLLIAVVVTVAMMYISPEIGNAFSEVGSAME
jgi:pilus assembly protein Flp/PilA